MLYINDRKKSYYLYDDVVVAAINSGVDPKRAYLFLAGLGVRGVKGRVVSTSGVDYLPAVKIAVINNKVLTSVKTCEHCNSFVIS